jgi:hypothetical protein
LPREQGRGRLRGCCRDDGDPFHQLRFRQHAEADGRDLSGEGLGEVDGRDLGDLERVATPLSRRASGKPGIGPPSTLIATTRMPWRAWNASSVGAKAWQ